MHLQAVVVGNISGHNKGVSPVESDRQESDHWVYNIDLIFI